MTVKTFLKKVFNNQVRLKLNVTLFQGKFIFNFFLVISVILSVWLYEPESQPADVICRKDFLQKDSMDCRPSCENGEFILRNMSACSPWLTCEDLTHDVIVKFPLAEGTVKKVHYAEWKGHAVVMSELQSPQYEADFRENLQVLKTFSRSPFLVQLVGSCNDKVMIAEYHNLGSALNAQKLLETHLSSQETLAFRLGLCASYVSILKFFHTAPNGARVMCDSSTLLKTLSQYLLTDDLQLVANDVDALPEVNPELGGIVCGHRELQGDFVAPEQRWHHQDKQFDSKLMGVYDEKSDIWKVPDVCDWFLGTSNAADVARFRLFDIHKRCKSLSPALRPNATEILAVYTTLLGELEH